jgi:hypothetical protein
MPQGGEAFTLLTTDPGPDVAPADPRPSDGDLGSIGLVGVA